MTVGAQFPPQVRIAPRSPAAVTSSEAASHARIGPNAVLQTLSALRELEGPAVADAVAQAAGLPERWPQGLIPEAWFIAVLRAVRRALPRPRAEAVLARSGARTAAYVARHRIPAPFRGLLRLLPRRWAVPLLLRAFRRHAWTFAGSGRFELDGPAAVRLAESPTSRAETAPPAGMACSYYASAFEGLLALADPQVRVREVACRASGAPACRFTLDPSHPPRERLEPRGRSPRAPVGS